MKTIKGNIMLSFNKMMVAVVLLLGVNSAYAECYDASATYEQEYETCLLLAKDGDAVAQYNLGLMYDTGYGVVQNYKEAVKWYTLSAEQGDASAQNNMGAMYLMGTGVVQNYKEAIKWFTKSAEQGEDIALNNLGLIYYDGNAGVEHNYKEAIKWYTKSAEQGNTEAQTQMGVMYNKGQGVPENLIMAHMWINIAVGNGGNGAEIRETLETRMTKDQIAEAQEMASKWMNDHPS